MQNHTPRLLALEITRKCRFNCRHCRADADCTAGTGDLTTEQWKKILDSIAAYAKGSQTPSSAPAGPPCVIILTGGEPMEREDIYDLIRHGRDRGLRMVMATCGYAITDESLAALRQAGVTALSFSIDGATAATHDAFRRTPGAFDTVMRAADAARRADLRFQINTTITRGNLAEVPEIAELARRLGASCWNPFILVPTGRGEQMAGELLEPRQYAELLADLLALKSESPIELRVTCGPQYARLYREAGATPPPSGSQPGASMAPNGCMGGRGFGFISHRGDVQTCGFLDICAGNLVDSGYDFAQVWDGSPFLQEIRDLKSYTGRCGRCAYLKVCSGCRARAYAMTGDYLAEDPICWYEPRTAAQGASNLEHVLASEAKQSQSQSGRLLRRPRRGAPLRVGPRNDMPRSSDSPSGISFSLTDFQKRLGNCLQEGLPLCSQPFARIAELLGSTEAEVLRQTRELKESGVIRRLSAFLNHRALGRASTLVTAHVPVDRIDRVAAAVNALAGVSHNYLREHHYNLWFTLQESTPARIVATLRDLREQLGIDFHDLPVTRVFKLDVRFDLEKDDDTVTAHDDYEIPSLEPVALRPEHKRLLHELQGGIDIISRPFDGLCTADRREQEVLALLGELKDLGVLRRIAAVLNYPKLGYTTNVLLAAEIPAEAVVAAGQSLARFRTVSHCYERRVFEGWPYNLFAMLHARSTMQIERTIRPFTASADVRSYCLLPTAAELKKQPVRHEFL